MKRITHYPEAIKTLFLTKLMANNSPGMVTLTKEFNIPYSTAFTWKRNMLKQTTNDQPKPEQRPTDKTPEEKLTAVLDVHHLSPEEQGAYCRTHGIHSAHIAQWQQDMLLGLGQSQKKDKESRGKNLKLMGEMNTLKKNIRRKDKALAEVTALLILKKKADFLWGESEEDL